MAPRPHVVYLNSVARLSGAELALARTLPALMGQVQATVILAEDGPLVAKLEALGADVIVLPLDDRVRAAQRSSVRLGGLGPGGLLVLVKHILRLRRLMRALDADLIHTNNLKSALYGGIAGRLAGIPVVWHIRDRIAEDYLPRPAVVMVRVLARILPRAVIANSQATMATLPARRRRAVLASPVVPNVLMDPASAPRRQRDQLTVGIVGRLSPWKGQDVFLRAFAQAFPETDAQARIIGSAMFGEEAQEATLHALAEELGIATRVDFRGFREDVFAEYAELDLAVHASTVPEPFGQVVLEAMAAGVPIIASAEGGPAEVITDGVDGVLVPPRDPAALAATMRRLAGDAELRRELAVHGLTTAAGYTPERTAAGVLQVYRSVMGPDFAA